VRRKARPECGRHSRVGRWTNFAVPSILVPAVNPFCFAVGAARDIGRRNNHLGESGRHHPMAIVDSPLNDLREVLVRRKKTGEAKCTNQRGNALPAADDLELRYTSLKSSVSNSRTVAVNS
jgi:hypothetical protein